MIELLSYDFFRNALIAVIILSICAAIVGAYIVTRRLAAIAGGVTHACFGGLGLGYFLGISPLLTAGAVAVASSLGVEWVSRRHSVRPDSAIAVVWSLGMAVGVIFVFLTPGYVPELNSFLFGNILTVSSADLLAFTIFTALLIGYYAARFEVVTACAFDPDFARVRHLPVTAVTTVMTIFIAVGIVLTIRLVGVMLLMSMISLPVMTAELFTRRMKPLVILSGVISAVSCVSGLFVATVVDVPASALIVIVLIGVYAVSACCRRIIGKKCQFTTN